MKPFVWPTATLGDLTARTRPISYGVLKPGPFIPGGIPLLRIQDLAGDSVTDDGVHRISPQLDAEFARSRLRGGEVLLSIQGTIGRCAICPESMAGANVSRTLAIIAPDERLLAKFLRYYLLFQTGQRGYETSGSTRASLNISTIRAMRVPLPPLEEQRRIVDILEDHFSRLDAACAYIRLAGARALTLGRSSVESVIRSVPSRRRRLHELVARVEAGRSFGAGGRPAAADEWGIIKVSAMTWGAFRPEENKAVHDPVRVNPAYEIHAGDVLVSRANTTEYVGASVYVETTRPRLLLSDKSLRIVPRDGIDPQWLQTVLSAPSTRAQISERATGTKDSMRNISQRALLSVEIPVPAADDQAQVVEVATGAADSVARLLNTVQRSASRAAALRRALLDAAYSGRLTGASSDVERIEESAGV